MPAIYYNNRWSTYDLLVVVKSSDVESHGEKKDSGQGHCNTGFQAYLTE